MAERIKIVTVNTIVACKKEDVSKTQKKTKVAEIKFQKREGIRKQPMPPAGARKTVEENMTKMMKMSKRKKVIDRGNVKEIMEEWEIDSAIETVTEEYEDGFKTMRKIKGVKKPMEILSEENKGPENFFAFKREYFPTVMRGIENYDRQKVTGDAIERGKQQMEKEMRKTKPGRKKSKKNRKEKEKNIMTPRNEMMKMMKSS